MYKNAALITGAANGLGAAFTRSLLASGKWKVNAVDIDIESLEHFSSCTKDLYRDDFLSMQCDVTIASNFEEVFAKTKSTFKRLDLVVNNAGIGNEEAWEQTIDINLVSVIRGTYLAIKYMGNHTGGSGGHVINISSMAGVIPMAFGPVYSASKHGVVGFTRCFHKDVNFVHHGVRVNCLCPSFTDTSIIKLFDQEGKDQYETNRLRLARSHLRKVGVLPVSDVTSAFMKLVSDPLLNGASVLVTPGGVKIEIFNPKSVL